MPSMVPTSVICKVVGGRGSTELAGQLVHLSWWVQRLVKDPTSKNEVEGSARDSASERSRCKTRGPEFVSQGTHSGRTHSRKCPLVFTHASWPVCPPTHVHSLKHVYTYNIKMRTKGQEPLRKTSPSQLLPTYTHTHTHTGSSMHLGTLMDMYIYTHIHVPGTHSLNSIVLAHEFGVSWTVSLSARFI